MAAEFTRPQPAGVVAFRIRSNLLSKSSDQEDQRGAQARERNQATSDRRSDLGMRLRVSALARFSRNVRLAGPIKLSAGAKVAWLQAGPAQGRPGL